MRAFRSEKVSAFVKAALDCNSEAARDMLQQISSDYPIAITRDLARAKGWIRERSRGSERFGLVASSGAHRLKPHAIVFVSMWIQSTGSLMIAMTHVRATTLRTLPQNFKFRGSSWTGYALLGTQIFASTENAGSTTHSEATHGPRFIKTIGNVTC